MERHPFVESHTEPLDTIYSFDEYVQDVLPYIEYHFRSIPYMQGTPKEEFVSNWIIGLIIIAVGALSYISSKHRKRFNLLSRTLFNWKIAKQIIRYEKVYTHPVNITLTTIFIIITPVFFAYIYQSISNSESSILELSISIAIPFLAYLGFKLSLHQFFSWLFDVKSVIQEYIFQSSLFNKIYGVFNLSFLIILLFSYRDAELLGILSILSLVLFILIQIIRGFLIGTQNGIQAHLIILYLCTLEILPWILLGKFISNQL